MSAERSRVVWILEHIEELVAIIIDCGLLGVWLHGEIHHSHQLDRRILTHIGGLQVLEELWIYIWFEQLLDAEELPGRLFFEAEFEVTEMKCSPVTSGKSEAVGALLLFRGERPNSHISFSAACGVTLLTVWRW